MLKSMPFSLSKLAAAVVLWAAGMFFFAAAVLVMMAAAVKIVVHTAGKVGLCAQPACTMNFHTGFAPSCAPVVFGFICSTIAAVSSAGNTSYDVTDSTHNKYLHVSF